LISSLTICFSVPYEILVSLAAVMQGHADAAGKVLVRMRFGQQIRAGCVLEDFMRGRLPEITAAPMALATSFDIRMHLLQGMVAPLEAKGTAGNSGLGFSGQERAQPPPRRPSPPRRRPGSERRGSR